MGHSHTVPLCPAYVVFIARQGPENRLPGRLISEEEYDGLPLPLFYTCKADAQTRPHGKVQQISWQDQHLTPFQR